jgi:hypothetical protein
MERHIVKCQRRRSRPTKLVIAAVAALAVFAATPAIGASVTSEAQAAATAKCRQGIEHGPPYSEPICFDEHEVAEAEQEIAAAREAAEALAVRAKALGEPVKFLAVSAVAHPAICREACEYAWRQPGYTALEVTTAPYSFVTLKLVRYGHRTERLELGPEESKGIIKVPWTCESPGGVFHYTVSAHSNVGETLVRRGTFRPVSAARCHWLRHAVQVARERDERLAREGERERAREERERLKQWEGNCRALGDTPAVLHEEGGILHVCRTPSGYTIEVPE